MHQNCFRILLGSYDAPLDLPGEYALPILFFPQRIWRLYVRSGFLNMITWQP